MVIAGGAIDMTKKGFMPSQKRNQDPIRVFTPLIAINQISLTICLIEFSRKKRPMKKIVNVIYVFLFLFFVSWGNYCGK